MVAATQELSEEPHAELRAVGLGRLGGAVALGDVRHLVGQDARQLSLVAHGLDQPAVDVDVSAGQRKGVDFGGIHDTGPVREPRARRSGGQAPHDGVDVALGRGVAHHRELSLRVRGRLASHLGVLLHGEEIDGRRGRGIREARGHERGAQQTTGENSDHAAPPRKPDDVTEESKQGAIPAWPAARRPVSQVTRLTTISAPRILRRPVTRGAPRRMPTAGDRHRPAQPRHGRHLNWWRVGG